MVKLGYTICRRHHTCDQRKKWKSRQLRGEADHLMEGAKDWFSSNGLKLNEEKILSLLCSLKSGLQEEEAVKLLEEFWVDLKLS